MIASLNIQTALREKITFLKTSFCTPPFKVSNVTENKQAHLLKLMLVSTSPGILDGDEYKITIDVAEDTSLHLQTQSFQRLYNMQQGASQKMEVTVGENAAFYFLPHPTVPHRASSFSALNNIYLSGSSVLLWGEVITCGRKGSGEYFQFSSLKNLTQVFIHGRLMIRENVLIRPSVVNVHAIGQLEGFSHQATLIFLNETCEVKKSITDISAYLSDKIDIEFGITAAPANGFILRLLGNKAEKLFDLLKTIANNYIPNEIENQVA